MITTVWPLLHRDPHFNGEYSAPFAQIWCCPHSGDPRRDGIVRGAVAAEPTAPYDAFTLNGSAWNYSFDSSNATVTLDGWGTGFIITAYTLGHEHLFRALVSPPSGQTLGVGTFATVGTGGDGRYRLDVGGDGRGCGEATGS